MRERESYARGALLGLAVGDALGAPWEGAPPPAARAAAAAGLRMAGGGRWAPGEWTDDTALALALAESLADRGALDRDDVVRRYAGWLRADGKGAGATLAAVLSEARDAADAERRARDLHARTGRTAGNGTVMRAAPIALAARDAERARADALADARLTHADPAAGLASAALCAALRAVREGGNALDAARAEVADHPRLVDALALADVDGEAALAALAAGPEAMVCSTTLAVALRALRSPSYREGVTGAIALGGDADTNAAVAGALLGARDGPDGIPGEWLAPLRERERIERAARRLAGG